MVIAHDHHHHGDAQRYDRFRQRPRRAFTSRGLSQERTIRVERDILSKNDAFAAANRTRLRDAGVFRAQLRVEPWVR